MPVARSRSIGAQLVFRFTLAAAVLLSCTLGGFYLLVVRHTISEDNAVLANKLAELREQLHEPGGPAAVAAMIKAEHVSSEMPFYVRLLREPGTILAQTPGFTIPSSQFSTTDAGRTQFRSSLRDHRDQDRLYSLASASVSSGEQNLIVQLAQDRSEDDRFRRRFGLLVLGVLLVAIAASAAIALPVAHHSLQPVRELTRLVERTDEAHLSVNVTAESWPSELQPLGAAFDRMLARLNDSFRRLSQFSADLAHELRTPIANMMGEAQVALTRPRPNEEYHAVLESTIAECERLSGIVESLLFLARAESGGQKIQVKRFDARSALDKIAGYFQPVADEHEITIAISGRGELVADAVLFERAVSNLVDNALRHTPAGGKISLALATAAEPGPRVTVSDTGAGIPASDLPRVFDRFYRADPSRSASGSGLGLALVKSIAELHGGSAAIASEAGRGTTVTLLFPGKAGV